MVPLPDTDPDGTYFFSELLTKVFDIFMTLPSLSELFKPPTQRPPPTERGEIINLMDFPVPSISPTPLTPSRLPIPTGFELKPAGPEKEPWIDMPWLQSTDEYAELTSNPWQYKNKRSSIIPSPLL